MSLLDNHLERVDPYLELLSSILGEIGNGAQAAGHIAMLCGQIEQQCTETRLEAAIALGTTGTRQLTPEHCESIAATAVADELRTFVGPRRKLVPFSLEKLKQVAAIQQSEIERGLETMLSDGKEAASGNEQVVSSAVKDRFFKVIDEPKLIVRANPKDRIPKPYIKITPGALMTRNGNYSNNDGAYGQFELSGYPRLSSYISTPQYLGEIKAAIEDACRESGSVTHEMLCQAEFYYTATRVDILPKNVKVKGFYWRDVYSAYAKATYLSVLRRGHKITTSAED